MFAVSVRVSTLRMLSAQSLFNESLWNSRVHNGISFLFCFIRCHNCQFYIRGVSGAIAIKGTLKSATDVTLHDS